MRFHVFFVALICLPLLAVGAFYGKKRRKLDHLILEQDSDYFYLYEDSTTLPFLNEWGVFAKYDIPAGEIICEYRGQIVLPEHQIHFPDETRYFDTYLIEEAGGEEYDYTIVGNTICSLINDAVHVFSSVDSETGVGTIPYSTAELDAFEESDEFGILPTLPGFAYNANYTRTALGKVFIVSTRMIAAGEEIFYPYGL